MPPPPPRPLEDPELNGRFNAWQTEWYEFAETASLQLARARRAVRDARGAPLDSPAWRAARDAVLVFVEMKRHQREQLRGLMQLRAQMGYSVSASDLSRLTGAIEHNEDFLARTESNLTEVLLGLIPQGPTDPSRLASPTPPPPPPRSGRIPMPTASPIPFEDAGLNQRFDAWQAEWDSLGQTYGVHTARARTAVREAREAPAGSPLWLAAREAVRQAVETRWRQQSLLWRLARLPTEIGATVSEADQRKLSHRIQDRELRFARSEYFLSQTLFAWLR